MVKYLSIHSSSFWVKIPFNVNGKATVWHTPCSVCSKDLWVIWRLQHYTSRLSARRTHMWFRATLDKGPRSRVQWNWAFLLIKSFKLVSSLLDEGPGLRQIKLWFNLHGILKGKPIGPEQKKNSFKESSWFGEPKCKLGFKVAHFLVFFFFFHCFLNLCCSNLWECEKRIYGLKTLLRAYQFPQLFINS